MPQSITPGQLNCMQNIISEILERVLGYFGDRNSVVRLLLWLEYLYVSQDDTRYRQATIGYIPSENRKVFCHINPNGELYGEERRHGLA